MAWGTRSLGHCPWGWTEQTTPTGVVFTSNSPLLMRRIKRSAGQTLPKLQRLVTTNYELSKVQDNLHTYTKGLESVPIMRGRLLEDITFDNAGEEKTVAHGLARNYRGYNIVRASTNVTLSDDKDNNDHLDITILLTASAACVVSLWIF